MRYDDDYDYNSRSSRNGSRRSSSSRSSGRDYDRDYYDRDYRSDYGRSYDYNRGYSDRNRYSDRYDTRSSRDFYDDFDRSDWERTAPDWEEHGNRKKRSSSSSAPARRSGSSSSRSGRSSDRSRDRDRDRDRDRRPAQSSRNGSRRSYDYDERDRRRGGNQRRSGGGNNKRRSALQFLPVIIGLVVIILAALVIRNMLSGNSDYSIQVSSNIVLGETATATLVGRDNAPLSESTQVEWSSRDNNVISVSGDGPTATLTAESLGNATIVASINGETVATQTVTAVETAVGVAAIRVSQEEITIPSGESYTINATVEMEEEYQDSPATIQWSSNNTSVPPSARMASSLPVRWATPSLRAWQEPRRWRSPWKWWRTPAQTTAPTMPPRTWARSRRTAPRRIPETPAPGRAPAIAPTPGTPAPALVPAATPTRVPEAAAAPTPGTLAPVRVPAAAPTPGRAPTAQGEPVAPPAPQVDPNPTANIPGGPRRARLFVLKRRR